jgi:hypothetical protein
MEGGGHRDTAVAPAAVPLTAGAANGADAAGSICTSDLSPLAVSWAIPLATAGAAALAQQCVFRTVVDAATSAQTEAQQAARCERIRISTARCREGSQVILPLVV